jgi:hypothetical protein
MARDPSTEARSTPAALTVMLSIRQRSEQQHPRSYPQLDPLPVKRDAATSIDACAQQPKRGALQHCSRAARSNTAWVPANLFISQVFWASNSQIDPRTCARSEARAVAAWGRVPARMVRL